jgi:uncharacterized protein (TIGR00251 family)
LALIRSLLRVRVIPRASKSAITGRRGDAIVVRLAAPPVDGAANDALIDLLSRVFRHPRRDIAIVSGEKSRDKRVSIEGITEAEISARLFAILNDND